MMQKKVTKWFYSHCQAINTMLGTLILSIEEEILKSKDKIRLYIVYSHSSNIFQIQTSIEIVTIDLKKRICLYRYFDIFGISCFHAITAIGFLNFNPYEYCED